MVFHSYNALFPLAEEGTGNIHLPATSLGTPCETWVLLLFAFRAALILYDIYSASITQLLQSTVPFVTLDIILHKGMDMVNNNSLLL